MTTAEAPTPHTDLKIPEITSDMSALDAAYAYASASWHVLPIAPGSKSPGSIVGTGWQHKSTRDPQQIADWWLLDHPDAGIALHVGRSGAIVLDVDTPTSLPDVLTQALTEHPAPFQRTRRNDAARRHYIYQQPPGRRLGNGLGRLPSGWGDLRGANGVIIVAPSIHPDTDGHYVWGRTGTVPQLPDSIADLLTDTTTAVDVATDHAIRDFITTHDRGPDNTAQIDAWTATYQRHTAAGDSRHQRATSILTGALKEAAAGYHPAEAAELTLRQAFIQSVTEPGHSEKQGAARTHPQALEEWRGILAWAIAQATVADPADTIDRAEEHNPTRGLDSLIDTRTTTPPDTATAPASGPMDDTPTDPLDTLLNPSTTASPTPRSSTASWGPVDLTPYLDGTHQPTLPTLMERTDGHGLIYPGLVHTFYGESESGKSFVVQGVAAHLTQHEHAVLYVDYESNAQTLTTRLVRMGASPDQIRDHFTYVRPNTSPDALHEHEAFQQLIEHPYTLVVLDGVTEALVQSGKETNSNDDITAWMRRLPYRIAEQTGAAVVLIDHVVKNTEGRGRFPIGGQAKMASVDGAAYLIEPETPIGVGLAGTLTMRIGKDREGEIRPHAGEYRKTDRTQEAARIVVDSTQHGVTEFTIQPPHGSIHDQQHDDGKPFRPTKVMEKVSRILETMREPTSRRSLYKTYRESGASAKETTVAEATNLLVEGGYVLETEGPRNARMFRSANVYRPHNDPLSDDYTGDLGRFNTTSRDRLPTVSDRLLGDGATVSQRPSPAPPSLRGAETVETSHTPPSNRRPSPASQTHVNKLTGEIHTEDTQP